MTLTEVPADRLIDWAGLWYPHFQTYARRRNAKAIYEAMLQGEIQVHLVRDGGTIVAAIGTRVFDHEHGRIGELVWVGGRNLPAVLAAVPTLETKFRERGCSRIIATGRFSWKRLLAPQGYSPSQITLEKTIG